MRKRTRVEPGELAEFNRRLILEHRVGQGDPAPADVVRAQLLLVVNGFARGTSGVRLELLEHLVARLNDGAAPVVRMLGSIGMADLPANADLAHGVLDGFELAAKEGLALLGNNAFSTALAALALADAMRLLDVLDVAAALDLEALAGNLSALHGAAEFAALLDGSYLWDEGAARKPPGSAQLPLHPAGARRRRATRSSSHTRGSHRAERVAGEPARAPRRGAHDLGRRTSTRSRSQQALDFTRIALAPVLTTASERTVKLLQAPVTGLPEGLAAESGLAESGLSEFGVPVQALAAEAKLLAAPVSIETASTSHHEGIEDRITLAPLGARRLAEMVELGERIAAIELVVAAQAIDLRGRPQLGRSDRRALRQGARARPGDGARRAAAAGSGAGAAAGQKRCLAPLKRCQAPRKGV